MADPTYSTTTFPNAITLGKDCTINVGGGKLNGVTSVSINCEADEIDVSTRDDNGFAKSLPGKKTVTVDIEFKRIAADASQNILYTAYNGGQGGSPLGLTVTTTGGAAVISTGTFAVMSLNETQDMDDAVVVSASLKNYGAVTFG